MCSFSFDSGQARNILCIWQRDAGNRNLDKSPRLTGWERRKNISTKTLLWFYQLFNSVFPQPTNLQGRISENNEKRSDEEQRKIDEERIARNILDMANHFPRNPIEDNGISANATKPTNNEASNPDVNGFMPEWVNKSIFR